MTKKHKIELRVTEKEKNLIKARALLYTEGNISKYILMILLNKKALPKRKGHKAN